MGRLHLPVRRIAGPIALGWGCAAVFAVTAAAVAGFELNRYTIDPGGGYATTGTGLEIRATIGQVDAGSPMTGDGYALTGGFWFALRPGDGNWDGGVNGLDYIDLESCLSGPMTEPGEPTACTCFDFDQDDDVDLLDFAEFQIAYDGF